MKKVVMQYGSKPNGNSGGTSGPTGVIEVTHIFEETTFSFANTSTLKKVGETPTFERGYMYVGMLSATFAPNATGRRRVQFARPGETTAINDGVIDIRAAVSGGPSTYCHIPINVIGDGSHYDIAMTQGSGSTLSTKITIDMLRIKIGG